MKMSLFAFVFAAALAGCASTANQESTAAAAKGSAYSDLETYPGTMIRRRQPAHATQVMSKEDAEALDRHTLPAKDR
jgi:hypothetical protein